MKRQVVVIHGGDTFGTYAEYLAFLKDFVIDSLDYFVKRNWKDALPAELGERFEVISPRMPNKTNAKYAEWKIWFEKLLPFLGPEVVLVGHSLGGTFLAKYLSENNFPRKIRGVFLVAAPYDGTGSGFSLADFNLSGNWDKLQSQTERLFVYHSKDDPVVHFADFDKYKSALPNAHSMIFESRGHFSQGKFPELVNDIKGLFK